MGLARREGGGHAVGLLDGDIYGPSAPTLLEMFGYAKQDISTAYGPSLFERHAEQPGFTSGDVFGLFSERARWHPIDLDRRYLEPDAGGQPDGVSASRLSSAIQAR